MRGVFYIPRLKNRVAHELAKVATTSPVPHAWFGADIPFWITDLTRLDWV